MYQNERSIKNYEKTLKQLCTGVLTLATVLTALPTTVVHVADTQYWTDPPEKARMIEKVINDSSIGSTFNEAIMQVKGLEKGTKYQLKGWQMIKDENAVLIINRKRVENDYTFTATDSKMETQIAFTFDASKLSGKQLVTFEEL